MACVSRSSSCRLFSRAVISTPPAGADVALAVCAEGEPVAASGGAAAAGCCGCGCMSGLVLTAAAAVGLPATLSLLPYIKSCIRCGDGRRATTTARGCAGVAPGRPTACRLGVTTTAAATSTPPYVPYDPSRLALTRELPPLAGPCCRFFSFARAFFASIFARSAWFSASRLSANASNLSELSLVTKLWWGLLCTYQPAPSAALRAPRAPSEPQVCREPPPANLSLHLLHSPQQPLECWTRPR